MGSDGKAARKALRSAIQSWFGRAPSSPLHIDEPASHSVRTELSSTVFSADSAAWVSYLGTSEDARYEADVRVAVRLHTERALVLFEPENETSRWLAELLSFGFRELSRRLSRKPHAFKVFRQLVFDNEANQRCQLTLRVSSRVPSEGTRESRSQDGKTGTVRLVVSLALALAARESHEREQAGGSGARLGAIWALVARVMQSLAYPAAPRDLFVTKIDTHARLTYLAINVLYAEQKRGLLWPTDVGTAFAEATSRTSGKIGRAHV